MFITGIKRVLSWSRTCLALETKHVYRWRQTLLVLGVNVLKTHVRSTLRPIGAVKGFSINAT